LQALFSRRKNVQLNQRQFHVSQTAANEAQMAMEWEIERLLTPSKVMRKKSQLGYQSPSHRQFAGDQRFHVR